MCRFKSGIILKNRVVVAGEDDSHSRLLESLGIEDNDLNAMKTFVRAELYPIGGDKFSNPQKWIYNIDQDVLPDWYTEDPGRYEKEFREAVESWCTEHVLLDKKIDELNSGYYLLKRCEVKKLCKDVVVLLDSSTVQNMRDSSTVQNMRDNSTVQNMLDNSTVQNMRDNSTVQNMWDRSVAIDRRKRTIKTATEAGYTLHE